MAENFSYKILNENEKKVEITYNNKTLKFKLKVKRSFTVFKELLKAYPDFFNIHILDGTLNDPNRAHSDLRIANGFANFLIETKSKKRVMQLKLNVKKLFNVYKNKSSDKFLSLSVSELRRTLTEDEKTKIHKKFDNRCNIIGIRIYREKELKGNYFLKHLILASYDHRKPILKNGSNDEYNWQLVSKLVNDEKNKICNICKKNNCEKCALAYPEKYKKILANNQDISELQFKK